MLFLLLKTLATFQTQSHPNYLGNITIWLSTHEYKIWSQIETIVAIYYYFRGTTVMVSKPLLINFITCFPHRLQPCRKRRITLKLFYIFFLSVLFFIDYFFFLLFYWIPFTFFSVFLDWLSSYQLWNFKKCVTLRTLIKPSLHRNSSELVLVLMVKIQLVVMNFIGLLGWRMIAWYFEQGAIPMLQSCQL